MTKSNTESKSVNQSIEQLQARYHDLNKKKIQAETNLDNAKKTLDNLKAEAREKFGSDDVDELREKLRAMKAENEEKRQSYQAELDRIETDLANVEKNLGAADDNAVGNSMEES
jgi:hypothetical protein